MKLIRLLAGLIIVGAIVYFWKINQKPPLPPPPTFLTNLPQPAPASPTPTPEPPKTITSGSTQQGRSTYYNYVCFLPTGSEHSDQKWPLIFYLHGQFKEEDLNRLAGIDVFHHALSQASFPFLIIAPSTARGWNIRQLSTFLDEMMPRYPIDPDRVYLTGVSMGGHGTWSLAIEYPGRFAAIAPVSGAGNPRAVFGKLDHMPAWVFHGERDTVVPLSYGLQMIGAMRGTGAEVKYTLYPDNGHDISGLVYDNPELYQWFLLHKRNNEPLKATPTPHARWRKTERESF